MINNNAEKPPTFIPRVPKYPELLLAKEEKNLKYKLLYLYLGTLFSGIIQRGEENHFMVNFRKFLEENLGTDHLNEMVKKIKQIKAQIQQQIQGGREIVWLHEVGFQTSQSQIENIMRLIYDTEIRTALSNYKDPLFFLRDIITGKVNNINIKGKEYSISTLLTQPVNSQKGNLLEKISLLLRYGIPYYYFNFSHLTEEEVENLVNSHVISLTTARVDLLGFQPINKDDSEVYNLIRKAKAALSHFMLDIFSLSSDELTTLKMLVEAILQGKIKMIFVEIKCEVRKKQDGKKIVFDKTRINDNQYEDMAHSIFSMFEFLTRLTNLPQDRNQNFQSLIDLMNPNYQERLKALFSLRKIIRQLIYNQEYYLIKIHWPIIERQNNDSYQIDPNLITNSDPDFAVIKANPRALLKALIVKAKNIFKK